MAAPSFSLDVLMTLASCATTAAAERPSGEDSDAHALRIFAGIAAQLKDESLSTGGAWAPVWLALSPGNANLAYIAQNPSANQLAVCIRGTIALLSDLGQDMDVGTVVSFRPIAGAPPVAVSAGAMTAFTGVTLATAPAGLGTPCAGMNLIQALSQLTLSAGTAPTIYVTGHSLGGCVATLVAPYLQAQVQEWPIVPTIALCTFAAPTAGLQGFADMMQATFGDAMVQVVNDWDVVPQAWWNLDAVKQWYPDPGPAANTDVKTMIGVLEGDTNGNVYVQPAAQQSCNGTYTNLSGWSNPTMADFEAEVAAQHANATYLHYLGAAGVPTPPPQVISLSERSGSAGDQVTVFGTGFLPGAGVDFGIQQALVIAPETDTAIQVIVPPGVGMVPVTVTSIFGTSAASTLTSFAFGGPPPVVVTGVSPQSGTHKGNTEVNIFGKGFLGAGGTASVSFGGTPGTDAAVVNDTMITVNSPAVGIDAGTVDIIVTVGVATSPTSPADEYTFTSGV